MWNYSFLGFLLLFAHVDLVCCQDLSPEASALFPVVSNLATRSRITANATCGENEPEVFCKLVEHVRIFPAENRHCDICDLRGSNRKQSHPITNAIDGRNSWWQSPTISNGRLMNYIQIDLDLGQVYQVAYVIVKAANAPRPGNWILQRSVDGITYKPWQYFALSDSECREYYGIQPTSGVPKFSRDDEVICTSRYSRLNPLENGEIFVSLINGRPGVKEPTKTLLEFTSARYIRLNLQKIRTLHADLMNFRNNENLTHLDPTVTRRYFYSIKDISVGGQCICYGHARLCRAQGADNNLQCECEHNTCGKNCEVCCPGFNQKPWGRGINGNGNGYKCEACNCHGKASDCVYNATVDSLGLSLNERGQYDGGGVCINCQSNTGGVNCETCIEGYFRPMGVPATAPNPCRRCSCRETRTSTSRCVADDSFIMEGLKPGDCICKPGFGGVRCEQCQFGFYGYPNCKPCPCNPAGSANSATCDRRCVCKENVEGRQCDRCRPGYYNLDRNNPEGCTKCFCFGVTTSCGSSDWGISQVTEMNGWVLSTRMADGLTLLPRSFNGWLEAKTYILTGSDVEGTGSWPVTQTDIHYWVAPMVFTGNRLSSYGGMLKFTIKYILDSNIDKRYHLSEPDVIIEGGGMMITNGQKYLREETENRVGIVLHESEWRKLITVDNRLTEVPLTKGDMMRVLQSIMRVMIRATYHTAQDTVYLRDVSLDVVSPSSRSPMTLKSVEKCNCPPGYAGLSCESCSPGWRRQNGTLFNGVCLQCNCNRHSSDCDTATGTCMNCQHNTTGPNCDKCIDGFYGDPRRGSPDDCQPCACPLLNQQNNFADQCVYSPTLENRFDYQCLRCKEGHTGKHCEQCAAGYYGNPMMRGGYCKPCSCSGNIDVLEPGSCNNVTGECQRCRNNAEGEKCDRCKPGYYGVALEGGCTACNCYLNGSYSENCRSNGDCSCRPRYTGQQCDRCQAGYGDITNGCSRCRCNRIGSVNTQCDNVSGQCRCHNGVTGLKCDRCNDGFYRLTYEGCTDCECYRRGTYNNSGSCDSMSGQCNCLPNVQGRKCDSCPTGYWGLDYNKGCTRCECNNVGAINAQCDVRSGQCTCRNGVGGRQCEKCLPGYYGFHYDGCKVCEPCNKEGHICDQQTGKCVCPPNMSGPKCEKCDDNHWGLDNITGCKRNVEGQRCTDCKRNTFGFDSTNPYGCTECFCFGRSQTCRQAPYAWTTVSLPVQRVSISQSASEEIQYHHGYPVIKTGITRIKVSPQSLNEMLYWSLPSEMLGDKTRSYNGKLDIIHYFETANPENIDFRLMPSVVIMIGNGFQIYYHDNVTLESSNPQGFSIRLHEYYWCHSSSIYPISRALLMVVLQNVQAILIPATNDGRAIYAELGPIGLQLAQPVRGVDITDRALGVELCQCPEEYSGNSCQNPGDGYYREKQNGTIGNPIITIGISKPCQCFSHSDKCDSETGQCINCKHNTTGKHCDSCAPGYYGVATRGSPWDCAPCACPLIDRSNNFSPTCVNRRGKLVCTNCTDGYEGERCERCSAGYYGNPSKVGETCQQCNCNPEGSVSPECDLITGHCLCLPGIEGDKCNKCQPGSAVQNGTCTSCYGGCTGILLTDLQELDAQFGGRNFTVPLPWKTLYKIENDTNMYRELLNAASFQSGSKFPQFENGTKFLEEIALRLMTRVEYVEQKSLETAEAVDGISKDAADLEQFIKEVFRNIRDDTEKLEDLVKKLIYEQAGLDVSAALEEAKKSMRKIKRRDFTQDDEKSKDEKWQAQKLYERVKDLDGMNFNGSKVDENIKDIVRRLEDLKERSKEAREKAKRVIDEESSKLANQIASLEDKINDAKDYRDDAALMVDDANYYIKEARDHLDRLKENYIALERKESSLGMVLNILDSTYYDLRQNLNMAEDSVRKAWLKARELDRQAQDLDRLFSKTRADAELPLRAAKVYQNIVDAINLAENASRNALKAARDTANIANIDGLRNDVRESKEKSQRLLDKARMLQTRGLEDGLLYVQSDLEDLMMKQQSNRDMLNMINRDMDNFSNGLRRKIDEVGFRIAGIGNRVDITAAQVGDTVDRINKELEPKLEKLRDIDMKAMVSHIRISSKNASENLIILKNLTDIVGKQSQAAKRLNADVSGKIIRLKEKIRLARERANNMKLSLAADGECMRSYRSKSTPSTANTIDFAFKLNKSAKNEEMLMLLVQKSPTEYMALEVRNELVYFRWNVGSGEGFVIHDQPIKLITEQTVEQDHWYRVTAKRIGRIGLLKVKSLARVAPETVERNRSSAIGSSVLKFDSSSDVFIAGAPGGYSLPPNITRNKFVGCIGDIKIDDITVGVFNFKTNQDTCQACVEVPSEPGSSNVYNFDGTGYSEMKRGRYHAEKIAISFSFKTYWENSILHFSGDSMGDFMSIELVDGKVVLQYYMGGMSLGKGQTKNTYNTNKWVKVYVDRKKLQALLTVDNEKIFIDAKPGLTGLDLKNSPMYFGGIPNSLSMTKFNKISTIETDGLLGCMKDVSVGPISVDLHNLFTGNYVGMSSGCKETGVRTVGFYGTGFSMYEGQSLSSGETDISVSFVTKQPEALLLLSTDIPQSNYYSLSLKDGYVIAQFTVDAYDLQLKSNVTFNDGALHNIGIIKDNKRVALMVDDKKHTEGRLPRGSDQIRIDAGGSLYLGGTPTGLTLGSNVPTKIPLDGCLSNIIINGGLIAINNPKQYSRADIGRCKFDVVPPVRPIEPEETGTTNEFPFMATEPAITNKKTKRTTTKPILTTRPNPTTTSGKPSRTPEPITSVNRVTSTNKLRVTTTDVPESTTPTLCGQKQDYGYQQGGSSFGNTKASFAQVKVKKRDVSKSFNISFEFRTYYENGLFAFITNGEQSDYVAAQLKAGYLEISYIRTVPTSIQSRQTYNDGRWHSVRITKERKDLMFIIDNRETKRTRIRAKLDIDAPIYIGGLPNNFDLKTDQVVRNSIRGCVKNVYINKDLIDLSDTKIISGVGQCYKDVEKGAYFSRSSWGAYRKNVRVTKDWSIELSFRTGDKDGIIITSSSDDGQSALAIELVNGQVQFTVKNGAKLFRAKSKVDTRYKYCDVNWHMIKARILGNVIGLTIDNDEEVVSNSPGQFEYMETETPLFIGGTQFAFKDQAATSVDVGFMGCIKDIKIQNTPLDWYDLVEFGSVRRTACPTF